MAAADRTMGSNFRRNRRDSCLRKTGMGGQIMKFFMTPGSCSTGIHILLEELELVFEVALVNLLAGDQRTAEFLAINPKGTIPVLVLDDGTVLADFQAIAWWLARQYPKAGLLPTDSIGESRILELMNFVTGTLHTQGFARIFTTAQFTPNPAEYEWVKQQGREIIARGFSVINGLLSARGELADRFSIADAALFYVEFWADKTAVDLPEACRTHYRRILDRPAVRRVLAEEGYRIPQLSPEECL